MMSYFSFLDELTLRLPHYTMCNTQSGREIDSSSSFNAD